MMFSYCFKKWFHKLSTNKTKLRVLRENIDSGLNNEIHARIIFPAS